MMDYLVKFHYSDVSSVTDSDTVVISVALPVAAAVDKVVYAREV